VTTISTRSFDATANRVALELVTPASGTGVAASDISHGAAVGPRGAPDRDRGRANLVLGSPTLGGEGIHTCNAPGTVGGRRHALSEPAHRGFGPRAGSASSSGASVPRMDRRTPDVHPGGRVRRVRPSCLRTHRPRATGPVGQGSCGSRERRRGPGDSAMSRA
jgi:hypothetical protein